MRIGTVALLGGAMLALGACGSSGGGGGSVLGGGVGSKWSKDDACKTLPKEAVAAAAGMPVTSAENTTSGTPDTSVATCMYALEHGSVSVLIRSSDIEMSDADIAQFKDAGGLMPGGVDEPGLGMKAFWNDKTRQLQVVPDRKHYFTIAYGPELTLPGTPAAPGPDPKAMALTLAKQLL